jgi:hypothetical protein
MLEITTERAVFYIVAPANVATGGPELLHQLAFKLKNAGKNVHMFYVPSDSPNPVHDNYQQYGIGFVRSIKDDLNNVLIVPEVQTQILKKFLKLKSIVWWLSVDNYFCNLPGVKGRINRFFLNRLGSQNYLFFDKKLKNVDFHLAQSKYANVMLQKNDLDKINYLSDYLHESFLRECVDLGNKINIVAYNPNKGIRFTNKLIKSAPHIKFIAIENMSRQEVVDLLKISKIYIDFGSHPGKDRIPREAAFLKCCVLTNKRGSAYFNDDLPIPNEFKFDECKKSLPKIVDRIEECFSNFEINNLKFDSYRLVIEKQEVEFETQIKNIFG